MNTANELHVVFGTGAVGMAVMEQLHAAGKRIRMVNRSGDAELPQDIELLSGDASNRDFARRASEGASVVYFALNPPYDKWPELFPPLQAAVLAGAATAGAKLISIENVYMYGHTHGKPMTEETPYNAHTKKGKVRAQMADALLAAHRNGTARVVIGRASDYYGPRALLSAMGDRIFYPALDGKAAQVLGDPDMPHTYTYISDIGKSLVMLGEQEGTLGQVWHLPAADTVTTREFVTMIYEEVGYPVNIQTAPKLVLRLMGLFNPRLRELLEVLYQFEEPFVLDDTKFTRHFGDVATPLADAIRETLAWYRAYPGQKVT